MLDGGKSGGTRLVSRKTVELMTQDHLGKIGPDQGFGLGFGVDGVKSPLSELGSPGQYNWGGFFYTAFVIDPKEQMITVFMAQLHPDGRSEPGQFISRAGHAGDRRLRAGGRPRFTPATSALLCRRRPSAGNPGPDSDRSAACDPGPGSAESWPADRERGWGLRPRSKPARPSCR